MKTILSALFLLSSSLSYASGLTSARVVSADIGINDQQQRQTLCLTVVEVKPSSEVMAIVEDITDCYYARQAKNSAIIEISLADLKLVDQPELRQHLQSFDSSLPFYFSEVE